MRERAIFKLISLPLYALIYNLGLSYTLTNFFQKDNFILTELNTLIFLYLPLLLIARIGYKKTDRSKSAPKKTRLLFGLLFFFTLSICSYFVQITYTANQFSIREIIQHSGSFSGILPTLVSSVILAPLFEEVIFRRLLFPEVQAAFPRTFLLLLSLSFMSAHLLQILQLPITIPFYFIVSLLLNLFYRNDPNLIHNILYHGITNLTASLAPFSLYFVNQAFFVPIIVGTLALILLMLKISLQKTRLSD